MKSYKNCPYCDGILRYDYGYDLERTILNQTCSSKIDHFIRIKSRANDYSGESLIIRIDMENLSSPFTWAVWNFKAQTIVITKGYYVGYSLRNMLGNIAYIPFFEPDLSDYPKLVNKIKGYIVFS